MGFNQSSRIVACFFSMVFLWSLMDLAWLLPNYLLLWSGACIPTQFNQPPGSSFLHQSHAETSPADPGFGGEKHGYLGPWTQPFYGDWRIKNRNLAKEYNEWGFWASQEIRWYPQIPLWMMFRINHRGWEPLIPSWECQVGEMWSPFIPIGYKNHPFY